MMFARTTLCGVLLVSLTILGEAATAEDMTKEQIIRSLQVPTRGLSDPDANPGITSISPISPMQHRLWRILRHHRKHRHPPAI